MKLMLLLQKKCFPLFHGRALCFVLWHFETLHPSSYVLLLKFSPVLQPFLPLCYFNMTIDYESFSKILRLLFSYFLDSSINLLWFGNALLWYYLDWSNQQFMTSWHWKKLAKCLGDTWHRQFLTADILQYAHAGVTLFLSWFTPSSSQ